MEGERDGREGEGERRGREGEGREGGLCSSNISFKKPWYIVLFWMLPNPSIESNIVSYLNCLWIVIC